MRKPAAEPRPLPRPSLMGAVYHLVVAAALALAAGEALAR